jgi:hypothetical protein
MARSMSAIVPLSHGEMVNRASGACTVASWLNGIVAP